MSVQYGPDEHQEPQGETLEDVRHSLGVFAWLLIAAVIGLAVFVATGMIAIAQLQ